MAPQGDSRMTKVNPFFLAVSRMRRRKYDDVIDICTDLLDENPRDQACWFLKCRALTCKQWIDDIEVDEEGVADILMDENAGCAACKCQWAASDWLCQTKHQQANEFGGR